MSSQDGRNSYRRSDDWPGRRRPRRRRARRSRTRVTLLTVAGVATVIAAAGYGARAATAGQATHATQAAPAANVTRTIGGWGRGGYPMVTPAPANAANATAATSMNWAGYAAAGAAGTFTSVSTSWTQPTVTCTAANTFSSFWVGLDGDGTTTVEQTGTEADCTNGAATYQGWWEMFPNAPVFYNNPVQPGDAMSASVVANGNGAFTLTLSDTTMGWTQTTHQTSATAQLGSAEVIAEAPSTTNMVLPLSNFGTVNFTNATVNGAAVGNDNPTAITMVSAAGVTEATPSALNGGNAFTVTWDSSGT